MFIYQQNQNLTNISRVKSLVNIATMLESPPSRLSDYLIIKRSNNGTVCIVNEFSAYCLKVRIVIFTVSILIRDSPKLWILGPYSSKACKN